MPVKMINKTVGINDPLGVTTRLYEIDEVVEDSPEWKKKVGEKFVEHGHAMYIDAEVVVPMHKDYDSLPSDVEPKQSAKTEKTKQKKSKKTFWSKK